uniref:DNA-(apurinic or apyrimidinic site) lyase n=1 Tax=Ditylenchus dipsaci TaxID=166011 RepID=A0A915CQ49_9BILA
MDKLSGGRSYCLISIGRVLRTCEQRSETSHYAYKSTDNSDEENCKLLRDYFQLDVDVEVLYADWASKDEHFATQLKSNLNLLSANNNVARISKMIERLCELYGTEQEVVDDDGMEGSKFYDFPSLNQLRQGLSGMEEELRRSNFGYRAAYIADTVKMLSEELDGDNWLMSLRNLPYLELKQQLSKLPGIGPKVADCICLMGFQKHEVVPVDTHVFQITAKFYMPEYLKSSKKTVTKKMHEDIGQFYINRFGLYAGWAHTVLFTTRLKRFKADMVDSKKGKKVFIYCIWSLCLVEGCKEITGLANNKQNQPSPRRNSLINWIKTPKLMLNGNTIHANDKVHIAPYYKASASTGDLTSSQDEGFQKQTLAELVRYQDMYTKDDAEISFAQRHLSSNSSTSSDTKIDGFGWIRAGLLFGVLVLLLSFLVVLITAISMSAIATNGEVKNGGCYYLISRSLGPEFGGSIGLILYVANTVNASMNCVGLAETIVPVLNKTLGFQLIDGDINDTRVYGLITCLILQGIIFVGTEFENKTQLGLMVTIIICILSHFVGTFLPITEHQRKHGIVGYSLSVFMDNLMPAYTNNQSFIDMFGVYFPAMTESWLVQICTFWAIAVTTITYTWCMFITAAATVRDADGINPPIWNASSHHYNSPACSIGGHCEYGLRNDYQIMTLQGAWEPLIIDIPSIVCRQTIPLHPPLCKRAWQGNDPFRAYILTFFIASAVVLIGDLNAIAVLITNFFLAAFAITNFACFDASSAKSPGFRPGFVYYNKWLSLFGSALCIVCMFALSWPMSLITFLVFIVLFLFIKNNKMHINWGSSAEANRYRKAFISLLKITRTEAHVKNYRPQLLVLTGNPAARQALIDFAYCITNGQNLMLCGHVIPHKSSVSATALIRKLNDHFTDWLYEQKIKDSWTWKMQPNILLLGYNNNWITQCTKEPKQYEEYTGVISDAFESNMSVCVFRNENEGLDHSALLSEEGRLFVRLPDLLLSDKDSTLNDDLSRGVAPRLVRPKARQITSELRTRSELHLPHLLTDRHHSENLNSSSNKCRENSQKRMGLKTPLNAKFRTQIRKGVVDVWWLFDDGGLTLLLSYLLTTQNTYLPGAKMRVFTICSKSNPEQVHHSLVTMLKKFRIQFTSVQVFVEDNRDLYPETVEEHEDLLKEINKEDKSVISKEMLNATHERTMRYLRHRELLLEYSSASSIVIITLPLAAPSVVKSGIYGLWLELLSKDMPPTLFVRGNQTSVITYYS